MFLWLIMQMSFFPHFKICFRKQLKSFILFWRCLFLWRRSSLSADLSSCWHHWLIYSRSGPIFLHPLHLIYYFSFQKSNMNTSQNTIYRTVSFLWFRQCRLRVPCKIHWHCLFFCCCLFFQTCRRIKYLIDVFAKCYRSNYILPLFAFIKAE